MSHSFKSSFKLELALLLLGFAAAHADLAPGDSAQSAVPETSYTTAAPQQAAAIADDDDYGLYRHIVKNPPKTVWVSIHDEVTETPPPQTVINYGTIIQPVALAACDNPYLSSGWGGSYSGGGYNHRSDFEDRNDRNFRQDRDNAPSYSNSGSSNSGSSNSGSATVTVPSEPTLFTTSERPSRERGVQR